MAVELGTCGYVSVLRRTKVGPFDIEKAVSMNDLERLSQENASSTVLLPIKAALEDIPTLSLTQNEATSLRMGKKILIKPQHGDIFSVSVVFTVFQGVPVALVEPIAGEFRVLRGFHF